MRVCSLGLAIACACAVARNVCPTDTTPNSTVLPEGRVEWCAVTENASTTSLPLTTRTFDSALSLVHPIALPGSVDGPFTSWYPNGSLASHGAYAGGGERSQPEGLWAFWRDDGHRWVLGNYHHGDPTGCFVVWDERGHPTTGFVEGDHLRVARCTPPNDEELAIVEGTRQVVDPPIKYDVSALVFVGSSPIGASNADQIDPDPMFDFAFSVTVRKRFGRLRIGPTISTRSADDTSAYAAGASVGWELPKLHPRLDWEADAEIAVERLEVTARHGIDGLASFALWRPLPALQLGFALELSTTMYLVAALRADGTPARTDHLTVTYQGMNGTYPPQVESWQVGGIACGANVGLRLVIR